MVWGCYEKEESYMIIQPILGLIVFLGIAYAMSENRQKIPYKMVFMGIMIQFFIGIVLLKLPLFNEFFLALNKVIIALEESTKAGTSFVFGFLGGGVLPFDEKFPGSSYILAFRALPLILLISALSSLLFYWKILPYVVKGFSIALEKSLSIGGAEGLGISANIFVGMVESPLLIRPYLKSMTRSELFSLMVCGMATIAGTVMILYASILDRVIENVLGHILIASIMSAPAAIIIAKTMVPETSSNQTSGDISLEETNSSMDALTKGTIQGVDLLINITAMLITMVAIIHLINIFLGVFPNVLGEALTLQRVLGVCMAPIVWLMGIPWDEVITAGSLLGTKTVLNELIAYIHMANLNPDALSANSLIIMTYGLCGFANPGSLGIMIGGMGTMAPTRRAEIVSLGGKSIIAGTLATCMTGSIAGLLIGV